MFWSVHDHPDGRNGAFAHAHGAQKRGRGLHVDRDRAGREQIRPFVTTYHVIGAGEGPGVDGAPGQGPDQLLDEPVGPDAPHGATRIPGLLGDDQVAGVHAGGQPRAEARGQYGGLTERRVGQHPGDGALGRGRAHSRAQDRDRPVGAAAVAAAQREVLDAERAGDEQRGRGGLRTHQPP